jgi:two-component sensor histidine kinase
MNIYALFSLIAFVIFFQAVIYLAFFDKSSSSISKEFAVVCFTLSVFTFFGFMMQISENFDEALIYYRVSSIGRASIPGFLTFFIFSISKSKNLLIINILRYIFLPAYIMLLIKYAFLDLSHVKVFIYENSIWYISPVYSSPWFYLSLFNFLFCCILALIILYDWRIRAKTNREKKLANKLFYCVGIVSPVVFFTYYFASHYELDTISASTPAFVVITIVYFYYSIVKYRPVLSSPEILNFLILDQIQDFVIFVGLEGNVISVNRFLLSALGYDISEIQELFPDKLFKNPKLIREMIEKANQTGFSESSDNQIIGKNEVLFPTLVSCLFNKDKFGNPIGYVLVCNDYRQKLILKQEILERINREKQLQKIKQDLESLVERKTHELFIANEKLRNEILERKRVEEQIKSDLAKKVALIQEIHHRVKNNIQIVISLINMLATHEDIDEQSAGRLKELGSKVRSISTVHEVFYSLPRLSKINFGAYLKKSTGELYSRNKGDQSIIFRLNISDEYLDIDRAIACGIIFVELLTNALKYAFVNQGNNKLHKYHNKVIEIEFFKKENKYTLTVVDNGVGIDWNQIMDKPEAIGLQLVNILVKDHLNGNLKISSSDGTKYMLEFDSSN